MLLGGWRRLWSRTVVGEMGGQDGCCVMVKEKLLDELRKIQVKKEK